MLLELMLEYSKQWPNLTKRYCTTTHNTKRARQKIPATHIPSVRAGVIGAHLSIAATRNDRDRIRVCQFCNLFQPVFYFESVLSVFAGD